jgi:hypothetical protein
MISLSRGHLRFQARFDCFEMHQLCSLRDVLAVVVRSSVNVSVRCLVRQARFTPATKRRYMTVCRWFARNSTFVDVREKVYWMFNWALTNSDSLFTAHHVGSILMLTTSVCFQGSYLHDCMRYERIAFADGLVLSRSLLCCEHYVCHLCLAPVVDMS